MFSGNRMTQLKRTGRETMLARSTVSWVSQICWLLLANYVTLTSSSGICEGSVIYYYNDEQKRVAEATRDHFNRLLKEAGRSAIATEIQAAPKYYYAEEYRKLPLSNSYLGSESRYNETLTRTHPSGRTDQQYLHKNPFGYCGLGGTGLYSPRTE